MHYVDTRYLDLHTTFLKINGGIYLVFSRNELIIVYEILIRRASYRVGAYLFVYQMRQTRITYCTVKSIL